jgi:iron complex outermembrane receptor protein
MKEEFPLESMNNFIKHCDGVIEVSISDIIQWKPVNATWAPENIGSVKSYGAELLAEASKKFGNHFVDANCTYAYTVSKNEVTDTQLTFVPFHKFTGNLAYAFRNIGFNYQYLFNGAVYTLNDNYTKLKSYAVSNMGVSYSIGKNQRSSFGLQILYCWNESYQSVPGRPLPGRNFQANLILKF